MTQTPAGWHRDQNNPNQERYWDGTAWTDQYREASAAPPPVQYAQQAPAKKSHTVRNVILGIILVSVLGFAGCVALIGGAANEIDKSIKEDDEAALSDVELVRCGGFENGLDMIGDGQVKITNSDDNSQDYFVEVTYYAADGSTLGTGNATLENAAPGKTSTVKLTSLDSITRAQANGMTCKITDVTGIDF